MNKARGGTRDGTRGGTRDGTRGGTRTRGRAKNGHPLVILIHITKFIIHHEGGSSSLNQGFTSFKMLDRIRDRFEILSYRYVYMYRIKIL